jgi:hypothetical protein
MPFAFTEVSNRNFFEKRADRIDLPSTADRQHAQKVKASTRDPKLGRRAETLA